MKRPKKLYGACVNMSGLFLDKPIELTYNDEYELGFGERGAKNE